jgi:hypothetical protein
MGKFIHSAAGDKHPLINKALSLGKLISAHVLHGCPLLS